MSDADYIVVGAGAAGSVLAGRLASAGCSVVVIDGGRGDAHPIHRIPKGFFFTSTSPRYTFQYETEPIAGTQTRERWARGRVVGGSTTVNGMMYLRGGPTEWDELAYRTGSPVWSWQNVERAYDQLESHSNDENATGLRISVPESGDSLAEMIIESLVATGLTRVADVNRRTDLDRVGYTPATIWNGRRTTPARSFLRPHVRTRKITLLTGHRADSVTIERGRAVGVAAVRRDGTRIELVARREVLVCAGTIESVLLLERSGIGERNAVRIAGAKPLVRSPGVGEHVIEHHGLAVQALLNTRFGPTTLLNTVPKQVIQGARYLLTRRGPISTPVFDVTSIFRSGPDVGHPDVQGVWLPLALQEGFNKLRPAKVSGVRFLGYQIQPATAGTIHATGRGLDAPPRIAPRYFDAEPDRSVAMRLFDHSRRALAAQPLAALITDVDEPGGAHDAESAAEALRRAGTTIYHAVGSVRMGLDADDPLDPDLRVKGVVGLRVVDASALPIQVSGNSAAPVMALAWIAAELILGSWKGGA